MLSVQAEKRLWWQSLCAAGFAPIVFIHLVMQMYAANEEYLINARQQLPLLIGLALVGWKVLFVLFHWCGRIGTFMWMLITAYTLFFLVREMAFPLPLGVLDGANRFPHLRIGYHSLELGVFLLALFLMLFSKTKVTISLTGIACLSFGVFTLAALLHRPHDVDLSVSQRSPRIDRAQRSPGDQLPDIYQILFDEYQTVEHLYARQQRGIAPFDDFVCFQDNISNYNHTWLSFPSLFRGAEYSSDIDIQQWFNSYNEQGLLRSLKQNGYNIRIFGYHESWWRSSLADHVRCTNQIIEEWYQGRTGDEFFCLVAMRTLPSFLGKKLHPSKRKTSTDDPIPPESESAFYCTIKYREMVRGIKHTSPGGNYTFLHMILPHGPNVMDPQGQYVGNDQGTRIGQVYCVDQLVSELTAELKRLGRYDTSLIIVHADTGSYYDPDLAKQSLYRGKALKVAPGYDCNDEAMSDGARWPLPVVRARVNAALLIKPPNHRGYQVVDYPSQLLDLPTTILQAVGLTEAAKPYTLGCDLFHAPPGPERVRRTYVYGAKIGNKLVPHMQEFIIRHGQYEKGGIVAFKGTPPE